MTCFERDDACRLHVMKNMNVEGRQAGLFGSSSSKDQNKSTADVGPPTASGLANAQNNQPGILPDGSGSRCDAAGKGDDLSRPSDDPGFPIPVHHHEPGTGAARRVPQAQAGRAPRAPNAAVHQPLPAIAMLKVADVALRYGVAKATIWRWAKESPTFPVPFEMSNGTSRWRLVDLLAFDAGVKPSVTKAFPVGDGDPPPGKSTRQRVRKR
jgi:predicted DNA-binding transcriptional regulator AlpA